MFNDLFIRAATALVLFVAGLHLVAWGIIENGGASRRNPVWRAFSSFFAFELTVLKVLVGVALVLAVILLASRILPPVIVMLRSRDLVPRQSVPVSSENVPPASIPIPDPVSPVSRPAAAPGIENLKSSPEPKATKTLPRRTPTPEELKNEAIEQILKGF